MMTLLKSRSRVLLFWGVMDLLALSMYVFVSLLRGNIPFYSDVVNFSHVLTAFGAEEGPAAAIQLFFFVSLLMTLSLAWSAYMFLCKEKLNFALLAIQEVLRFASLTCSVSLIPLLLNIIGGHVAASLALPGFLVSECGKVGSLWWYHRHNRRAS